MKNPTPTTQDSPNISWLDQELRRTRAVVSELRDIVDKQQVVMADQAQHLVSLEDRLTKQHAQLLRIPDVEEALRNTRDEIVLMLSELRQEVQKRETEFWRNRQAEHEQDLRVIQEIQAQLERFEPLEQSIAVRQAEERRLNEMILRLQQAQEDTAKRIAQREEVSRQLADRIEQTVVRLGQLELAISDSQKEQPEYLSRIQLLETEMTRITQQMVEMHNLREDLTKQQAELAETQRRSDRDRAQTMTEWARKMEGFSHQLETWAEQLRYYTDQHDKNRRVLREVQELAHQVSQQQDQLRQIQRIAEDQMRHDLREWHSESERRWAQEAERRERLLESQIHRDNAQDQKLEDLDQARQAMVSALSALDERLKALGARMITEFNRLKREQLRAMQLQAKAAEQLYTETRGYFEEEIE
jgi:chromosome segregation ATPase